MTTTIDPASERRALRHIAEKTRCRWTHQRALTELAAG